MSPQERKDQLLANLEQIRIRLQQLRSERKARKAQEQQVLGALMLIDELMAEAAQEPPSRDRDERRDD